MSGLRRDREEPYAVLVSTRSSREDAEAIAQSFESQGAEAQVGVWERMGEKRFDVYLTGYSLLDEAGGDALRLREDGWSPQVVVLPGATEVAKTPQMRLLGSRLEVVAPAASSEPAGTDPSARP